eukprot:6120356-Prymnesium_polylepis.1
MQRAEQDLTFVGSVGNALYYWWNLPGSLDFRASAHASGRKGYGFRLTPKQELKHPGGDVFGGAASSQLAAPDSAAWEQL